MNERIWTLAEQNMARRERGRLIKAKRITFRGLPNVLIRANSDSMVLVDGVWKFPSLSSRKDATVKPARG